MLFRSKKKKNEFSKGYNINHEYLLNDEDYTTPSGLEFNLKTIGHILTDIDEKIDWSKYVNFYYIQTDVYYNGKKITLGDGISGLMKYGNYDVAGSINKAKKWLDRNGDDFIKGKKQFTIPST